MNNRRNGGIARRDALSPERRSAIASKAATARWRKSPDWVRQAAHELIKLLSKGKAK